MNFKQEKLRVVAITMVCSRSFTAFSRELFSQRSLIIDARLGSKYASDFNCEPFISLKCILHAVKLYLIIKPFNLLNII